MINQIFTSINDQQWTAFIQHCTYKWEMTGGYEAIYQSQNMMYYVPYRIGYETHESCHPQNEIEEVMKHCLLSRHHNGYIRQEAIELLVNYSHYPFVTPYLLRPLGGYIYPIFHHLYQNREQLNPTHLIQFRDTNTIFLQKTWNRIYSYWDAYFACTYPNFNQMPNVLFMKWLEELM